jgi:excisionase family DNA binding protein
MKGLNLPVRPILDIPKSKPSKRHKKDKRSAVETDLVGPFELSKALCVSSRTITNLCKRGAIPHYRIGKCLRFNLREVIAFVRRD